VTRFAATEGKPLVTRFAATEGKPLVTRFAATGASRSWLWRTTVAGQLQGASTPQRPSREGMSPCGVTVCINW